MQNKTILIGATALIIGVAGGFVGGIKYQESKRPSFGRQSGIGGGRNGGQTRGGFRPVVGEILNNDDTSITVKLQDGSGKIVLVSDKTEINKADKASKDELKMGVRVAVFGTDNSDGSVTAQSIQLNPQFRGAFGATPSGSPRLN